ncbi:nitrite/sulfite reductase [uncultured Gemmiger sp.]|uniref:nitrite/sulfite reductase n=1 Tax=uncultured Gemmiger sp. TaxID=1623490 RepID=UPI0025F7A302|nr:nitrite/sulfite reductase [uncultured Gemmiger sp.]
MSVPQKIDPQNWKQELPAFRAKTDEFYAGQVDKAAYKGFSGFYGSYAQRGAKASMLRLRMTAGRVTKAKMAFVADAIRRLHLEHLHFTTCQTIQLHDLQSDQVYDLMEKALDVGIVTIGGGGDYPRNITCSPLAGVEPGEYFNVLPWAEAAGDYLMHFVKAEKMPRKLKVSFSSSPSNLPHTTYRDLGFTARADGKFDVYSAGGLGNNPRFAVRVAEAVDPDQILYYIKAMWLTFRAYGNYDNRARARSRYMQDALGGPEQYAEAFRAKLKEVYDTEDLTLTGIAETPVAKTGTPDPALAANPRVAAQKQPGLYAVAWHPIGGHADPAVFCAVSDALQDIPEAELRLTPDEGSWIINLTAGEARRLLDLTAPNSAASLFETSVACIGASVCQQGLRDSQALLTDCVAAVRAASLPDGALPQIHISGCPSSCGTHQTGIIGFRGAAKVVDGKPNAAFTLYAGGCERQGSEKMGRELGVILVENIPVFLVRLGRTVAASGQTFQDWYAANPSEFDKIAAEFLA